MAERKFTRSLNKPGMAAQLRETVSQVVRETNVLNKPLLVEPIDFESFILKNKTLIQNDPQRELLLYPSDDVSQVILPRKFRTTTNNIPVFSLSSSTTSPTSPTSTASGQSTFGNASQSNSSTISSSSSTATIHSTSIPTTTTPDDDNLNSNINQLLPPLTIGSGGLLLTKQALHTYQSNNHLVHYKYNAYSGSCHDLPRITPPDELIEEIYEIDADQERIDEQMTRSQADSITKQGYLHKGPDSSSDRMFAHIGSKSFKRRYCYLRQEVDGTYILEMHKDEKQCEAKATIVMDFCTEVVQNPKRGRFCFELRMTAGHKSFTLAADNENDMQDWLIKLQTVLQQNKLQEDKQQHSLERTTLANSTSLSVANTSNMTPQQQQQQPPPPPSPNSMMMFGTLKGLEQSMNPQLMKYGRETDVSIAQARRENRRRLFGSYQNAKKSTPIETVEPYREQFRQRMLIRCESLKFRLQAISSTDDISGGGGGGGAKETLCQVEPYITTLALYDARAGKKLTENFYFDINPKEIRNVFQLNTKNCCNAGESNGGGDIHNNSNGNINKYSSSNSNCDFQLSKELQRVTDEWLMYPKQAIINITQQHPDIFLVVKIDKVLQGGINNSTEPYLKATKDPKLGLKLHRQVRGYHQKIGHYRMPFAWAARPLFRLYSSDLDTAIEFPAIYRQDTNKLKDEEILKLLSEYRKPDKFSKLTVIPGWLKITIEQIHELPSNCLTTTLSPLKPFPMPPINDATYEITEFAGTTEREVYPFTTFINHLFIYPLTLSFDSQKLFSRARNIAVVIELRESDVEGTKPLRCIYSRPGQKQRFLTQLSCPVLHHCTNPSWYEEIKLRLPLHITTQHHLLFSFIHISCDLSKKRDSNHQSSSSASTSPYENPVGYAWLPLLNKGKINVDEQMISVAATLPSGYLAIQPLGLGKGNAGPDIQWIDNQRPLFTVTFRLDSTVLTTDQHLHNLFAHTERILLQQKYYHPHHQPQSASTQPPSQSTNDNSAIQSASSRIICGIPAESETCKILKAAHAIHVTSVITFLPTILNQLFILLVNTNSEEIGLNVIRLLINLIHMVADEAGRKELLLSYVKYVFQTSAFYKISKQSSNGHSTNGSSMNHHQPSTTTTTTSQQTQTAQQQPHQNYQSHTVHSELCRHLPTLLHPNNTDFLIVNKFMKYSNIFVDIIIKSMAQYLMHTGRIRMHRNERFPREFPNRIESLFQVLVPYLFLRYKDLPHETHQLNGSLSRFIKRCLTFMDRGFVFKLIRMYMDRFSPGDPRQLQEYKFLFLSEICSHEHYIPLNLPFLLNSKNRPPEILQHFTLSEEFCRQHFLAGVLLQEVKSSLNEVGHIRRLALSTFKELLAKHDLDDRYQNKGQLARIAMLYTPWLGIVLENLNRIYSIDVNKYDKYRNKQMDTTLNKSINRISNSGSSFVFSRECQTPPTNGVSSYYNHHQQQLLMSSQNNLSSITSTPKSMASTKLTNRLTLHIDSNNNINNNNNNNNNSSPLNRQSMHLKDTNYFAVIAGQTGFNQLTNGHSQTSLDSECSTLSQDTAIIKSGDHHHHVMLVDMVNGLNNLGLISASSSGSSPPHLINGHNRSISVTQPSLMPPRLDKFSCSETKDLLICFLFIIKHLASEQMVMWWQNCTENEIQSFLTVLDLSIVYFRYVGKKNVILNSATTSSSSSSSSAMVNGNGMTITNGNVKDLNKFVQRSTKASTLPARMIPPVGDSQIDTSTSTGVNTLNHHTPQRENLIDEKLRQQQALQESVMTTEIGIIILDCLGLYTIQFRDKLVKSILLPKIAKIYLRYLQLGQSETLSKHVFAAIRAFINNFSVALFKGNSMLCGQLVYELLKCCDSRLANVRQEACAILYLLMRSNFEFSGRKGLTRVHLQVIISVSQMIGNVIGLNNARFQESLSLINSYATSDKVMKGTGFPMEVKDLTKRVRTVLMATAQMQAHQMDPERLLELQYSLANSYASTPELRHTWLVTMARNHEQNGNLSEAACCNLHIAALMAEYLKLRSNNKTQQPSNGHTAIVNSAVIMNTVTWGSESFERISRNIARDERGLKLDSGGGQQDSQYTEQILLDQLKECAEYLDRAERYECLGFVYELIVPILNARRDYLSLSQCYEHLAHAYTKIIDVNRSGKRMLGRFYRVVFFGQIFFEDDHGIEYVYKEPKLTSLSEISERLYKQYKDKFGTESVRMIMDSSPVIVNDLDPKLAYIQLTHVIPYFCKDELECRQNEFEQNHDVDTFMFETPFTRNGTARGSVEEQWKRRTILTTTYSFPYVLKRIPIKDKQSIELSPIEVAIDEMQNRVSELEQVVLPPIDVKKLQLRLQGSVAVQVNAGPLTYATAFLDPKQCDKFSSGKVEDLKEIFREFVSICNTALEVNGRMISNDQREYHSALKDNYQKLCCALSDLLVDESFMPNVDDGGQTTAHRNSIALFSAISGAPSNSSTA